MTKEDRRRMMDYIERIKKATSDAELWLMYKGYTREDDDREMTEEELKELADSPVVLLPSAQPEIIRCKDCKWYGRADKRRFYRGTDCLNHRIDTIVPDKDYCSRAERRIDEE